MVICSFTSFSRPEIGRRNLNPFLNLDFRILKMNQVMSQKWWSPGIYKTKVTEEELLLKGNAFLCSYFKTDGAKTLMRSPKY